MSRRIWLTQAIVALAMIPGSGCDNAPRSGVPALAPSPSLRLSCTPQGRQLTCHALARPALDGADDTAQEDVTDSATWSASGDTVLVRQGRVMGRYPGHAIISATKTWSGRSASASLQVVVETPGAAPQIAYAVEGIVRDLADVALAGVDVAISDERGHARDATSKEPEGSFTFPPLPAGQYRLRASKAEYRPFERLVVVPGDLPITVALIREPNTQ